MKNEIPHYLRRRAYLTTGDKILGAVLVIALAPLFTFGLPLLTLGVFPLFAGVILIMFARSWRALVFGKYGTPEDLPARYVNLTQHIREPHKIHTAVINTSEPTRPAGGA